MSGARPEPATARPTLIVLDVNETLSDLTPLAATFREVGLGAEEVEAWFAGVLRDAFALTVLGGCPSFAEIAESTACVRLAAAGAPDPDAGAHQVVRRFATLAPHPDVVPGLQSLAALGCRLVTLSNGSAGVARALLGDTDAGPLLEAYLSVDDAGAWKPAPAAYEHALAVTGVPAAEAMLVAVHPWDLAGAQAAGLRTAWISRSASPWPAHLPEPEVRAGSLVELAATLAATPSVAAQ